MKPINKQPILRTARLNLRPFQLSDAGDVQKLAGDKAIADTTLNIPHPYTDGMAEEWIATHRPDFEAGSQIIYAVVDKNDSLVGAIGLKIAPESDRAELGYWMATHCWNKGFCTEAGEAMLEYGFTELELNRIHATHLTRNPASGRVMQKLGMMHEGRVRQHAKKWDKFEDLELYGILRDEWLESRKA